MRFKATEEQVKEIAAKAVNASMPVGMGMFHYDSTKMFEPNEFKIPVYMDYVQGRMVKLTIEPTDEEDMWQSSNFPPDFEYQSWAKDYPGNTLLESVGAEIE